MDTLYGPDARDKIWSLIKDIKFALLATYSTDGHIFHARPMMAQNPRQESHFDGTLWFFTARDSRKADEIQANAQALVTYSDRGTQNYVSISGRAFIEVDPAKAAALWTDMAKVWFPGGKDDPNLVLIRFEAEDAEFWDGPGPIGAALSSIQALMTGNAPTMGETGHVQLAQ